MTGAGLLALLFVLKLVATTVSLGCGASGGIFSPSLYLGRHARLPPLPPRSDWCCRTPGWRGPSAAIIGMAAIVGASTGGVMTAIVMVFEMTRDYAISFPSSSRWRLPPASGAR